MTAAAPCPMCGHQPTDYIHGRWAEPFKRYPCSKPVPAMTYCVVGYVCKAHGTYPRTDVPLPDFVVEAFVAV